MLRRRTLASFAIRAANVALLFCLNIALARSLGPDAFGQYVFAFSLMTVVSIPMLNGLPSMIVRESASLVSRGEHERLSLLRRRTDGFVVLYCVVSAPAALLAMLLLAPKLPVIHFTAIALAFVYAAVASVAFARGAMIRGLDQTTLGQVGEMIIRPGVAGALVLIAALQFTITPVSAFAFQIVAAAFALLFSQRIYSTIGKPGRATSPNQPAEARWVKSIFAFSVLAALHVILTQTDILMIGLFMDASDVGIYQVGVQAAGLVSFGLTAVNLVIAPKLANAHALRDTISLQRFAQWAATFSTLAALPLLAVLTLGGKDLIEFFVGSAFSGAYGPMVILAVAQMVNAIAGPVGLLLGMTGHEKTAIRGMLVGAVANLVLNAALIPTFGLVGAALATGLSTAIWNILLVIRVQELLGVSSMAFKRHPLS